MLEGKRQGGKLNKIINIRPFCVICIVLIMGIVFSYLLIKRSIYYTILLFSLAILLSVIICFLPTKNRKKRILFVASLFLIFTCSFFNLYIRYEIANNVKDYQGEKYLTARVNKLSIYENGCFVTLDNCIFEDEKLKGKTVAFIPESKFDSQPDLGDIVVFKCRIFNNCVVSNNLISPLSGNYYKANIRSKVLITGSEPHFYQKAFMKIREFFKDNATDGMEGFAIALTTGDTSLLNEERLLAFRMAGIAHVFAVSGLHIGIFVSVFAFIAKKLKLKRLVSLFFVFIPSFLYCGLCGFRSSAVRALIMATVILLSNYIGFKNDNLSSASIAAIIILIFKPYEIFNVGFKLSFVAVTSIFLLKQFFERGFHFLKKLSAPLALSLSAQLGTLPLLTDMSGYMSIIALFANLIFVPIVSFCYVCLLICTFFGIIESLIFGVSKVFMFLPSKMLYYLSTVIGFVNYRNFIVAGNFGYFKYLWYFGCVMLSDIINIKLKYKLIIFASLSISSLVCALVFL